MILNDLINVYIERNISLENNTKNIVNVLNNINMKITEDDSIIFPHIASLTRVLQVKTSMFSQPKVIWNGEEILAMYKRLYEWLKSNNAIDILDDSLELYTIAKELNILPTIIETVADYFQYINRNILLETFVLEDHFSREDEAIAKQEMLKSYLTTAAPISNTFNLLKSLSVTQGHVDEFKSLAIMMMFYYIVFNTKSFINANVAAHALPLKQQQEVVNENKEVKNG